MRKLLWLVLLTACATTTPAPTPLAPSAEPGLRLSTAVVPTLIRLQLAVDPQSSTMAGVADLDVTLAEPASMIWLDAVELTFSKAEVVLGAKRIPAQLTVTAEHMGLAVPEPLLAGKVTLHLEYTAAISAKDSDGVFREVVGTDAYAFSHFEPFHARRAFPCFDEPSFKPAWELTLRVPAGDAAYSNAPLGERTTDAMGVQTFRFARTAPLPSYLVALAVGPLVRLDAGKAGRASTPLGVIVPRGQEGQARFAVQSAPRLLALLEGYLGSPCPYPKLDLVSIPLYGVATENPGLIVFAQALLLSKPEEETIAFRRLSASVMAHELSHLWVGDLVTNAWWDDLWLNEAFATWMGEKTIERFAPDWGGAEQRVLSRGSAMGADSLLSARQIRQPITSKHDIKNAFDGITYTKGAAVLDMFEQYLGPAAFQAGVQRYLAAHANGTATTADFLGALGGAAGTDLGPTFSSFLDQPGVPLVEFELECTPSGSALQLSQKRYLPAGTDVTSSIEAQRWQIPLCVRWSAHGVEGRDCTVLREAHDRMPLSSKACPDWVLPNSGASGYYRTHLAGDLLGKVLAPGTRITAMERLGMVGDAQAQVRAGQMPIDEMLGQIQELSGDSNRFLVEDAIGLSDLLRAEELVPGALKERYASFLSVEFGDRLKALGWVPTPGEGEDATLLRSRLLSLLGNDADDPLLVGKARALAAAWLQSHQAIAPDLTGVVLGIAARHGNQALFEAWHQAAKAAPDQRVRARLLNAMGSFRDPEIAKAAMALMLSDEFEIRESFTLLWGATQDPATREAAWAFVQEHFDALVAKLPRDYPASLPWVPAALCDDARRPEIEAFFRERSTHFAGGPLQLEQALESLHQCSVFRKLQAPGVAAFLRNAPPVAPKH